MKKFAVLFLIFFACNQSNVKNETKPTPEPEEAIDIPEKPLKVAVIGLVHTHVHWILGGDEIGDIEIVAIVEPNRELAGRYSKQHGYSMDLVYDDIDKMLENVKPEAVTAFNTIQGHLEVVQKCAPLGIHVMVEKPLAVNLEHANEMYNLARQHKIQLLTNYETTWYPSNHKIKNFYDDGQFGELRRIIVNDGHHGPKEIGVNDEFLEWLTNPELNGGGAVTDFGCYGANLITWLKKGQKPNSVYASLRTTKPDLYPNVDDDATILLNYDDMQGVIQASWSWTFARKDMEVYGTLGYGIAKNHSDLIVRLNESKSDSVISLQDRNYPLNDPFSYLSGVISGKIKPDSFDLSSLENNMVVMEILDAAIRSAETGKEVFLEEY